MIASDPRRKSHGSPTLNTFLTYDPTTAPVP